MTMFYNILQKPPKKPSSARKTLLEVELILFQ